MVTVVAEETFMESLSKFTGTPNLLDLVEAYDAAASGDEITDGNGLPNRFLCAAEHSLHSVCADK
jgi:hypothetical protein